MPHYAIGINFQEAPGYFLVEIHTIQKSLQGECEWHNHFRKWFQDRSKIIITSDTQRDVCMFSTGLE